MSAKKELILEEINRLNVQIASGALSAKEVERTQIEQDRLLQQLIVLNKALNEGTILKG